MSRTLALVPALAVALSSLLVQPTGAATFCTVTINSPDEREALRRAFAGERFVELTDFAPADRPDGDRWLLRACRAGVHCDVLLVSGHFANRFFGDAPFELPIGDLERRACDSECDGVLKGPRLVFLFGCNTLATKQRDGRSPGAYRDILIQHGLDPDMADRVVALRYAPIGNETRARIQKVFSRGALVFGFSSASPLGDVSGPGFARFLHAAKRPFLRALQDAAVDKEARSALELEWRAAFRGLNPDVVDGGPSLDTDECRVRDAAAPRLERLLSAERLLENAPAENALIIDDFLRTQSNWSAEESLVLARIARNESARRTILAVLPHLPDSPDVCFSLLQMARRLRWIDQAEFVQRQDQRVWAMLRDGVTSAELGFLCERELQYAPPPDVLARNRGSPHFLRALPCLGARTPAVRRFLELELSRASGDGRAAVLDVLRELRLLDAADVGHLRAMYQGAPGTLKESLLWALAASDGASVDVQRFIAAAALDPDAGVAWTSGQVLKQVGSTDAQVLELLAGALGHDDVFVRRGIALTLEALQPSDTSVLELLHPFRDDADPVVRRALTHVLDISDATNQ